MTAAVALAYEEQRMRGDEVAAQRRYHRVLALAEGKTATLLDHAQRYIPLLLRSGQSGEALKAFQTCRAKDAQFALGRPHHPGPGQGRVEHGRRERRPGPAARL